MATYERNPRLRRRLAILLASAEVIALTAVFFSTFAGYANYANARFLRSVPLSRILGYLVIAVTALAFLTFVVQAILYVKGRPWTRLAFLVENGVLLALGAVWFLKNLLGEGPPDRMIALVALVLPMATLFPLLWPLRVFRPVPPAGG